MPSLAKLAKRCPGISPTQQHVYAWGAMKAADVPAGSTLKRAAAAGAYPPNLCSSWSGLVLEACDLGESSVPSASHSQ